MSQGPCLEETKLEYHTWGSYGQYRLTTILLPAEDRLIEVDVIRMTPGWRGKEARVRRRITEYEIEVHGENNDSNKNYHRRARIISIEPLPPFIVIKNAYRSSKNYGVSYTVLKLPSCEKFDAEIVEEEKEEITEKENDRVWRKVKYVIAERYVVVDGKRYLIDKEVVDKHVVEEKVKKLEIEIIVMEKGVAVRGDTYHIKDLLKKMRYRWNGVWWFKKTKEPEKEADETKRMLETTVCSELHAKIVKW